MSRFTWALGANGGIDQIFHWKINLRSEFFKNLQDLDPAKDDILNIA